MALVIGADILFKQPGSTRTFILCDKQCKMLPSRLVQCGARSGLLRLGHFISAFLNGVIIQSFFFTIENVYLYWGLHYALWKTSLFMFEQSYRSLLAAYSGAVHVTPSFLRRKLILLQVFVPHYYNRCNRFVYFIFRWHWQGFNPLDLVFMYSLTADLRACLVHTQYINKMPPLG